MYPVFEKIKSYISIWYKKDRFVEVSALQNNSTSGFEEVTRTTKHRKKKYFSYKTFAN